MVAIAKKPGHTVDLLRDTGNHSVYVVNGQRIPVPRHREINELTAKSILSTTRKATEQ